MLRGHILNTDGKQRANWVEGEALSSQSLLPVTYFLQQDLLSLSKQCYHLEIGYSDVYNYAGSYHLDHPTAHHNLKSSSVQTHISDSFCIQRGSHKLPHLCNFKFFLPPASCLGTGIFSRTLALKSMLF